MISIKNLNIMLFRWRQDITIASKQGGCHKNRSLTHLRGIIYTWFKSVKLRILYYIGEINVMLQDLLSVKNNNVNKECKIVNNRRFIIIWWQHEALLKAILSDCVLILAFYTKTETLRNEFYFHLWVDRIWKNAYCGDKNTLTP